MRRGFLGEGEAGRGPGVERAESAPGSEVPRDWNSMPSGLDFLKAQWHTQATSVPLSMLFSLLTMLSHLSPSFQTFPPSESAKSFFLLEACAIQPSLSGLLWITAVTLWQSTYYSGCCQIRCQRLFVYCLIVSLGNLREA